jgi:hypothetical protein
MFLSAMTYSLSFETPASDRSHGCGFTVQTGGRDKRVEKESTLQEKYAAL